MKTSNSIKKLLYVEDDRASLLLISHLLRAEFDVEGAADAVLALDKVRHNLYDLILMDIKLGPIGKSGLEIVQEIRQLPDYKTVPIIAVTAYAMAGDREEFLNKGCNDYVAKPVDFKKLKQAISRQMKNSTPLVYKVSAK